MSRRDPKPGDAFAPTEADVIAARDRAGATFAAMQKARTTLERARKPETVARAREALARAEAEYRAAASIRDELVVARNLGAWVRRR